MVINYILGIGNIRWRGIGNIKGNKRKRILALSDVGEKRKMSENIKIMVLFPPPFPIFKD